VYNSVALKAGHYGQSSAWLRRSKLNLGCATVRWMDGISFRMYRIHNLCKWIYKTKQRAWGHNTSNVPGVQSVGGACDWALPYCYCIL